MTRSVNSAMIYICLAFIHDKTNKLTFHQSISWQTPGRVFQRCKITTASRSDYWRPCCWFTSLNWSWAGGNTDLLFKIYNLICNTFYTRFIHNTVTDPRGPCYGSTPPSPPPLLSEIIWPKGPKISFPPLSGAIKWLTFTSPFCSSGYATDLNIPY